MNNFKEIYDAVCASKVAGTETELDKLWDAWLLNPCKATKEALDNFVDKIKEGQNE